MHVRHSLNPNVSKVMFNDTLKQTRTFALLGVMVRFRHSLNPNLGCTIILSIKNHVQLVRSLLQNSGDLSQCIWLKPVQRVPLHSFLSAVGN